MSATGGPVLSRRGALLLLPLSVAALQLGGDAAGRPAGPARPRHPGPVVDARRAGAKGDGVSDDTVALQRALDRLGVGGGGTLLLPPGTYPVSASLAPPSRVRVLGSPGAASTVLDRVGNLNLIVLVDCTDTVVEGVRFQGRGAATVQGRGMVFGTTGRRHGPVRCRVVDNLMVDAGTCGIAVGNARDLLVSGNRILRPAEHGVYLSERSTGCRVVDNEIQEAGFGQTGTVVGVKLAHPGCTGNRVERNRVARPLSEGIICDRGATGNLLVANEVRDAPQRGVRINPGAGGNVVRGNVVRGAGSQAVRDMGAEGTVIEDNTIDSPACQAGIQLDGASRSATVRDNQVLAVAPDGWGISVSGRGHVVVGNYFAPGIAHRTTIVPPP